LFISPGTVNSLKTPATQPASPPYDLDLDSSIPMPTISASYTHHHPSSSSSHRSQTITTDTADVKLNISAATSSSSFRIAATDHPTNRIFHIGDTVSVGGSGTSLRLAVPDKQFVPIAGKVVPGGRSSPARQQSSPSSWRNSPSTTRGVKRARSETPTRGESPSSRGGGKSKKRRKGETEIVLIFLEIWSVFYMYIQC
jgi:hypothetical protein